MEITKLEIKPVEPPPEYVLNLTAAELCVVRAGLDRLRTQDTLHTRYDLFYVKAAQKLFKQIWDQTGPATYGRPQDEIEAIK